MSSKDTEASGETAPALTGQAAWKANLDRVQARNDVARKAGRLARKQHDDHAASSRDVAERAERKRMSSQPKGSAGTGKAYLRGDR